MATTTTNLPAPVVTETAHSEAKVSAFTDFVLNGVQWRLTMREGATAEMTLGLLREAYKAAIELNKAGAAFILDRDARENFKVTTTPNGNGQTPAPVNGNGANPSGNGSQPNGNGHDPAWCPIHQCEMRRFEKGNQAWYSHKTDDGAWCNGKAKK